VALAYLASSLAPPGARTSLFGLVTLPIQYLPYIMVGMDLLMGGPSAAAEATAGAVVGYGVCGEWHWGLLALWPDMLEHPSGWRIGLMVRTDGRLSLVLQVAAAPEWPQEVFM